MTFSRVNPLGWNLGDTLTSAQMNQLDINVSNSVDGAAGGTYTAPLLFSDITMTGTNRVKVASRSITRVHSLFSAFVDTTGTPDQWTNGTFGQLVNNTTTSFIDIPLDIPDNSTLTSVVCRFIGFTGHAVDPVDGVGGISMPFFHIRESTGESGTSTTIATVTDTTNVRAQYEAAHDISSGGLSHTIDRTQYNYHVTFRSEGGTDYIAGGQLLKLTTVSTVTEYPEF